MRRSSALPCLPLFEQQYRSAPTAAPTIPLRPGNRRTTPCCRPEVFDFGTQKHDGATIEDLPAHRQRSAFATHMPTSARSSSILVSVIVGNTADRECCFTINLTRSV